MKANDLLNITSLLKSIASFTYKTTYFRINKFDWLFLGIEHYVTIATISFLATSLQSRLSKIHKAAKAHNGRKRL